MLRHMGRLQGRQVLVLSATSEPEAKARALTITPGWAQGYWSAPGPARLAIRSRKRPNVRMSSKSVQPRSESGIVGEVKLSFLGHIGIGEEGEVRDRHPGVGEPGMCV